MMMFRQLEIITYLVMKETRQLKKAVSSRGSFKYFKPLKNDYNTTQTLREMSGRQLLPM